MKPRGLLRDIPGSRLGLVVASWCYAYAIHYSHVAYLNPIWGYYGFSYEDPGFGELTLMAFLVTLASLLLPLMLTRASSIVVLLLFVVVYVPTIVITLCLSADSFDRYGPNLSMLALAFAAVCYGSRHRIKQAQPAAHVPGDLFCSVMLYCWFLTCVVLVYNYAAVMNFVGLDEIYEQRAAGKSANLWMGYAQTYFSNVLSPALIALGLTKSRTRLVLLGTIGCIVSYMINAQRAVFLLPIVIIGLYALLKSRRPFLRTSAFFTFFLAAGVMFCAAFYLDNTVASFLSGFLVFRILGLPGLTFSQYYDLFSSEGYTWWSHVRGLDLLIAAPPAFANHPAWPQLGRIVGDYVYGSTETNANANLFSGDGVAAAGGIGVIVIGVVAAFLLSVLDRAARGWDLNFVSLVMLPVSLSLTNGHLSTTMLSFGGLFWILVFYVYKPRVDKIRFAVHTVPASTMRDRA